VLLPVLALIIVKGAPWHFALLLSLFCVIALHEFFTMALPERKGELLPFALYGGVAVFTPLLTDGQIFIMSAALFFLLAAFHFLFRLHDITKAGREVALVCAAFLYIPFLLAHLTMVRLLPQGVGWLLLIAFIVMAGDSAAYYVGSAFGKHRLYPAVSPKKASKGRWGGFWAAFAAPCLSNTPFLPS